MALVICPECGKEASSKAKVCPNCGYPLSEVSEAAQVAEQTGKKPRKSHSGGKIVRTIIIVVGIVLVVGIACAAYVSKQLIDLEDADASRHTAGTTAAGTETEAVYNGKEIRADFKEAMDSYEDFMKEYVQFMNKYADNPGDAGLLADYSKYMTKYADMVEKFDKWENEDLSAAETAYYIDVQARVSKLLLEASQS